MAAFPDVALTIHDDGAAPAPLEMEMDADDVNKSSRRKRQPLHCIIIGSVDIVGDHASTCLARPGAWPYCAVCGSTAGTSPEHYYAVCGGVNLADPLCCRRPRRPVVEVPCPLVSAWWPAVYPMGLLLSHLTCGRAVHAGPCLLDWPCAGPTYRREEWYEEEPSCAMVNCCGRGWSCMAHDES